jgi:uncharacterized protein (DUF1015 family)
MATIHPFRAYRPRRELAAAVASVPYDTVDAEEARALAAGNPLSFLHVTKPEIDLARDVDPYSDAVYAQGARALRRLIADGTLLQDDKPHLYAYELTLAGHRQTGIVLCASIDEYEHNIVRKHENTRLDKENDRLRHMEALSAQSGKVFLVHRDSPKVARELKRVTQSPAEYDFTAPDTVQHRFWVISEASAIAAIVEGFRELGVVYIADGHHRSAAAARYAQKRRSGRGARPDAEYERFLAVSFPESEVQILPYNRVVKDLGSLTPDKLLDAVRRRFELSEGKSQRLEPHQMGMYLGGRWYTLAVREGTWNDADPVARLDVTLLQQQLLEPVLGIQDPRSDQRIEFVGGVRGDAELERRVRGYPAVAFKMRPASIRDLFAIADAGKVMPPKSTWFEPKLRDGLVVHQV